jgi:hypothetical protein
MGMSLCIADSVSERWCLLELRFRQTDHSLYRPTTPSDDERCCLLCGSGRYRPRVFRDYQHVIDLSDADVVKADYRHACELRSAQRRR